MPGIELALRAIEVAILVCATVLVAWASVQLIKRPHLAVRGCFDAHGLGVLEGSLPNLQEVIVVAHRLEAPQNSLRQAVERNLAKGVRYTFLVSTSTAAEELKGYFLDFDAIAERVIGERANSTTERLVRILKLPTDWEDFPYVFYRMKDSDGDGVSTTIAVRGGQKLEGIADTYFSLPRRMAQAWAKAIMSDAPDEIETTSVSIQCDSFEDAEPRILQLPSHSPNVSVKYGA